MIQAREKEREREPVNQQGELGEMSHAEHHREHHFTANMLSPRGVASD